MRRFILTVIVLGALTASASAQLEVQVSEQKDTFLLYEPIPLIVSIRNYSGRTVQLEDSGEHSWLSFVVAGEAGNFIPGVGKLETQEPVLVPAGETISRTVDVLPLYDLREQGSYRVQAAVELNGVQSISTPISLTIINGRELWSQTAGLPPTDKGEDEYRTYSLVARSSSTAPDLLHVCVRDEAHQLVYGLIPLGEFLTLTPPTAQVDKEGDLHVLYQTGPRSYGYVQIDPYAKILDKAVYSDFVSLPQLVSQAGVVTVQGGELIYPKSDHVMTNDEDVPPPKPKPKHRKWWWPFGPGPQPGDS